MNDQIDNAPVEQAQVRKLVTVSEDILSEYGRSDGGPSFRRSCAIAVVRNPHSGAFKEDLDGVVAMSEDLGRTLSEHALNGLGGALPESYGKAALVGADGDREIGVALLTTVFAEGMRDAAGGGAAWISSVTKIGSPGTSIDVPLASKDALFVRSHYDAMTIAVPDAPLRDEVMVLCAYASRGRINARVGGLRLEDAAKDGLR